MPAKGVTRSRLRDQALVRALNEKLAAHRPSRMFIEFFCECDRGSCDESIPLAVDEFEALRRLPGHFAVAPRPLAARARRRDVLAVRRRRAGDGLIAARRARGVPDPRRGELRMAAPCGRTTLWAYGNRDPDRPSRSGRRGARRRPPPVTLDALGVRWRCAFDAAEDALHASRGCGRSLRFPPGELAARGALLARERADTARVLDELAREEHVHLVHRLSAPRATRRMLGLPAGIQALVLALDGVLTASAELHAAAWQETFEELLARRAGRPGERFAPSTPTTREPTTASTSTAGRGSKACARSSRAAGSRCRRARPPTRRTPRRCTGSPTARTSRCAAASTATAWPRSRARAATSRTRARPGCASRSSRRARTRTRSWSAPGSPSSSTCASTATRCASWACARGRPRTPSSPRASCSASRPPTRPASSPAAPASPAFAPPASAARSASAATA